MNELNLELKTHSLMLGFGNRLLSKSCALSMLGYLFYMLGIIPRKNKLRTIKLQEFRQSRNVNVVINCLTTCFLISFFILGGYNFIHVYDQTIVASGLNGNRFGSFGSALTYTIIFLNIATVTNILDLKTKQNEKLLAVIKKIDNLYIFNLLIMSIFLLMCGYRSGVLQIVLPLFSMLSYKRILKTKQVFFVLLTGVVLMVGVGLFRSQTSTVEEIKSDMSLLYFFRDFTPANVATPALIEYVDVNGCAYFKNALLQIIAIIPFFQSLFIGFFGNDFRLDSSSKLYTERICYSFDSGMGTSIIGDLYYTGGFLTVLFLMFFLGWIIRKISNSTNKYAFLILSCLVGNAIFMSRVEFFYIARNCGFSVLIYWLISNFCSSNNHNNKL